MPLIILGIFLAVGTFYSWKVAVGILVFFLFALGTAMEDHYRK